MTKIEFYEIREAYTDYLRSFDGNVPEEKDLSYSKTRKYIGVILEINNYKYFAPLSSPKAKFKGMKNGKDFLKINGNEHGAINFNNMIPVHNSAIIEFDVNLESDKKYQTILIAQAIFIRKNEDKIKKKAQELYFLMTNNSLNAKQLKERARLESRCCQFSILENACNDYQHNTD